jgi:hypothetical protein
MKFIKKVGRDFPTGTQGPQFLREDYTQWRLLQTGTHSTAPAIGAQKGGEKGSELDRRLT